MCYNEMEFSKQELFGNIPEKVRVMEKETGAEESVFIEALEKKRGGKITYREIALFYADFKRNCKESVFLYRIGDRIYLEDFEREFRFLGFRVKPPKGYKYVKFEAYFCVGDVSGAEVVLRRSVEQFVKGKANEVKCASGASALFGQTMLKLNFKDGSFIFLEVVDKKRFMQHLGL